VETNATPLYPPLTPRYVHACMGTKKIETLVLVGSDEQWINLGENFSQSMPMTSKVECI